MGKTKRHYTITEAAKRLGISRPAVFKLIKRARLKAVQKTVKLPSRIWLISSESLNQYQTSSKRRGPKKRLIS